MAWTIGAGDFVVLRRANLEQRREEKRFNIPKPEWFWMTALAALYSTACMAAAIVIAIFQFRGL